MSLLSPSLLPGWIPIPPGCWQALTALVPAVLVFVPAAIASCPTSEDPPRGLLLCLGGELSSNRELRTPGVSAGGFLLDEGPCVLCLTWAAVGPRMSLTCLVWG